MASTSTAIEWTDATWNPTTRCDKVSPGCKHCYAERVTERFPQAFPRGFRFTLHPERLQEPYRWKKPRRVFVNSMSGLFHEQMPLRFLLEVFRVMRETPQHIYQILTKRHQRLPELDPLIEWSENVWMGVSVENQQYAARVDFLRQSGARVRFLSCEPLLGPLELDLEGIHWVIVGGRAALITAPSTRSGCVRSGISASGRAWPSSSNSGAAKPRSAGAGCWMAVPGTSFLKSVPPSSPKGRDEGFKAS